MDDSSIAYGFCHCGCGEKTQIAEQNRAARGWIRGEPKRFVAGHYYAYRRKLAAERLEAGRKTCSKCGHEWPSDSDHFKPDGRYADGLEGRCRECRREHDEKRRATDYFKRYRAANQARNAEREFAGELRQCLDCGGLYPATPDYFRRDNSKPDGLTGKCRACKAKTDNEWYYGHWKEQREKQKVYSRKYGKTPNGILARRAANLRRRMAVRSAEGNISADEIWQMHSDQGGMCAYCEIPLFGTWHVDHMMPISRGGSNDWTNAALTCPDCNLRKGAKSAEEFMMVLRE